MATPPRYFQKGSYYHVYNRGNRKQKIFHTNGDYQRFMDRLSLYIKNTPITLLCYCLMPNHYHLLLRQDASESLTPFMLRLGTSYSKYFNIKYGQVGSLFQGRFKTRHVESDEYLLHLSRYIHRNPLVTPGVELEKSRWSSYGTYLRGEKTELVDPTYILSYFQKDNRSVDYKQFVEYDINEKLDPDPWG